MKLRVKLFGLLPSHFPGYNPEKGMEIDIPDGARVEDLLARLEISKSEAGIAIVNGLPLKSDSQLEEGMCVSLFPLVSGG